VNNNFVGTGKLGADPEVRFLPSGKAICELRVAFSNSKRKPHTDPVEYEYTPAVWVSITLWERMAENAADVLHRGDEVIASGTLELETFTRKDDTPGEKLILRNAEVAPSIRRQRRGELASAGRRSDSRPRSANGSDPHTESRPQGSAQAVRTAPVEDPPF
jgi:single-strand DNA-binding protein